MSTRISNPTNAVLEQRISALEGGIGAIAVASGQAALHLSIATLMGAGSHIVASTALYGGSQNLLHYTLRRFGIETTFVKPGDTDGWRAALRPNTKLFFGETVGNPGLDVLDIPTVSTIAHEAGVPLLVDSTLTTPWLLRPFEHGADLVYHSATKFLSGHGTVIGGLVVDGGSFDWEASGRFPGLCQPYDGFHNMVFSEESTVGAFLLRARREGLRDFGAALSPHSAWLILQGMETLPLRMARHMSNTQRVVEFLASQPFVARVGHPMLAEHPSHTLAQQLLPRGAVWAVPHTAPGLVHQLAAALASGNRCWLETPAADSAVARLLAALPPEVSGFVQLCSAEQLHSQRDLSALLFEGDGDALQALLPQVAQRAGAMVRIESLTPAQLATGAHYDLSALMHEQSISTNTAAAGGNAQLMTMG